MSDAPQPPGPLRVHEIANFKTLRRAARAGHLALVSAIRKADGAQIALVCAMQRNDDGTISPVPLASMIEGDPYELFEDPTAT